MLNAPHKYIKKEIILKMEKIEIVFSEQKPKQFNFENNIIKVLPYMSMAVKSMIIKMYLEEALDTSKDIVERMISAKMIMILGIVDKCTNIGVDNIDIEQIILSGLWDSIKNNILNYGELEDEIDFAMKQIKNEKEFENSSNSAINGIVIKISEFMDKISDMDLSEDGIAKILKNFDDTIKNFNDKYVQLIPNEIPVKKVRKKRESAE